MDWVVSVAQAVDPVICLCYHRGQGNLGFSLRYGIQLGLQLADLLLQFWVFIGQIVQDGGMVGVRGRVRGSQVLVTFQSTDIVCPELSSLCEGDVVSVGKKRAHFIE